MNIKLMILKKVKVAFSKTGLSNFNSIQICYAKRKNFGDYQINGIISVAKKQGLSPYLLAKRIAMFLNLENIADKIEIISPGFINIFLNSKWISKNLSNIFYSKKLGINIVKPKKIIVDYSSPNVAKDMHIGHMRSTIIGDSMVRILKFLGNTVIKMNHIGDWGTQFGMIIAYLEELKTLDIKKIKIIDLESYYKSAKKLYDVDSTFKEKSKNCIKKLQNGDKFYEKIWKDLVNITIENNQKIYHRMDINLNKNDTVGESFYRNMLPIIVEDLKKKKIAIEKDGTIMVILKEFKNKEGNPMGIIIQKKDNSYLYATTDLACLKYRCEVIKADRIIYYTDSRQKQYFEQISIIARKAKYVPKSVSLEHHFFGMILDKRGRPFKTRSGNVIKLSKLLDESINRSRSVILQKNPKIKKNLLEKNAKIVGIGSIKYCDLIRNRTKDYIFDWEKILKLDGNTIPYIQYAYVRILSLLKKSQYKKEEICGKFYLSSQTEINLAIRLIQLEEIIETVANKGAPNLLCSYLYDITVLFSNFYETCPILKIEEKTIRNSRLKLSFLTAKIIKVGLNLLGIKTVKKM